MQTLPTLFTLYSFVIAATISFAACNLRLSVSIFAWMFGVSLLAWSGGLRDFSSLPPAAPVLFASGFVLSALVGLTSASSSMLQLSLTFLVGFQSFRIIVELLIHQAVSDGIAPPQMTWSGLNFDIVTGVTALIIAPFAERLPRSALLAWNTLGLALLIWVVSVATLSFPTQFQLLWPSNVWIAEFPYVWLPTIHVTAALLMHIVLYRRLLQRASL